MALLLDRGGFGVALDHQQAAQHGAVFAGNFLPGRLALVRAERDGAAFDRGGEQDAPAVFRHVDEAELGPALAADADGGAQVDRGVLEALRPHRLPPVDVAGMPGFQRLADAQVLGEADIVRDQAVIVDLAAVGHGRDSLSDAFGVEVRPHAGAVAFQRAGFADRVGALEDPVLPGGQAAEDAGFHRFGAGEAQVGLQPGQRVGGERGAFLQDQPDLVVPVDVVIGEGDQAELLRRSRRRRVSPIRPAAASSEFGFAVETVGQAGQAVAHRVGAEVQRGQMQRGGASLSPAAVPANMTERSAAKTSSARVPAKQLPGSIRAIRLRAIMSTRLNTRFSSRRISRTSQSD